MFRPLLALTLLGPLLTLWPAHAQAEAPRGTVSGGFYRAAPSQTGAVPPLAPPEATIDPVSAPAALRTPRGSLALVERWQLRLLEIRKPSSHQRVLVLSVRGLDGQVQAAPNPSTLHIRVLDAHGRALPIQQVVAGSGGKFTLVITVWLSRDFSGKASPQTPATLGRLLVYTKNSGVRWALK